VEGLPDFLPDRISKNPRNPISLKPSTLGQLDDLGNPIQRERPLYFDLWVNFHHFGSEMK